MSLMEKFANPETFQALSFGDKMLGSTITLVLGMGLTIGVLLLVGFFMSIMTKALKRKEQKQAAPPVKEAETQPELHNMDAGKDKKIIAAIIAAAVAEYEGSSTSNLVVRKITRLSGNTSSWSASAKEECMASRKI